MKIAVISDIHGNGYALNQVLGHAKSQKIDRYFFLGDYITDGPNVNSILNKVREIGDEVVAGNREEYMLEYHRNKHSIDNTLQNQGLLYTYKRIKHDNLDYLATLSIAKTVTVDGVKILLFHGVPTKTRQVFVPKREQLFASQIIEQYQADIYICGHTHISSSYEQNGCFFFNPGSAGVPIRSNGFNYGILEIHEGNVHWEQITIPYDSKHMIQSLRANKEQYLQSVGFWSDLYFQSLQLNRDVVFDFLKVAYDIAGVKPAIGETRNISNDVFNKAIQEYKKKSSND